MIVSLMSLLAWAWLTQNWFVAAILSLLMLGRFFSAWRWNLKSAQFYRIGDFVTVLFVASLLYFAIVHTDQRPVFILLEWLPAFFAPILLAQLYSVHNQLPMGTLFYSVRKREQQESLDFQLPYAAICLLAAGAANESSWFYFAVMAVCFSAILWEARSKNSPVVLWFVVIGLAAGISYEGQFGLRQLQVISEDFWVGLLSDWQTDPFKSMTSIGDIGDLKLSNKIEFRVKSSESLLLLQSSYDRYLGQSWLASKRIFSEQPNYSVPAKNRRIKQLDVFQSVERTTILALPSGTVDIKGLEGAKLQYTPLGAVKLTEAPDFVNYQVDYTGQELAKTSELDLQIPPQHQAWLAIIKQALQLEQQEPAQIALAIKQYFQRNYYYSLFLGKEANADKALKSFMLERKAGHCEYFAVASVLLLRSYGIPARLANGYAMQEYSEAEQLYIVRRRHAHAWAIAAINGQWQAVDATPAQWLDMEEDQADYWQPVYDLFSAVHFYYKQWRYQQAQSNDDSGDQFIQLLVAAVLVVLLLWRLWVSRQHLLRTKPKQGMSSNAFNYPGQDSDFYLIEKSLVGTDLARRENEAIVVWLKRLDAPALMEISKLHYKYRFGTDNFSVAERAKLKQAVRCWLAQEYKRKTPTL